MTGPYLNQISPFRSLIALVDKLDEYPWLQLRSDIELNSVFDRLGL